MIAQVTTIDDSSVLSPSIWMGDKTDKYTARNLSTNLSEPLNYVITTTRGYMATIKNKTGATHTERVTAYTTAVCDSYSAYTGQKISALQESTDRYEKYPIT